MHSLLRRTDKILTHFPCLTDDRANAVLSSQPFQMPRPGHVGKLVLELPNRAASFRLAVRPWRHCPARIALLGPANRNFLCNSNGQNG